MDFKINLQLKLLSVLIILECIFVAIWRIFHCFSDFSVGTGKCPVIAFIAILLLIPGMLAAFLYITIFLIDLHRKKPTDVFDKIMLIVSILLFMMIFGNWFY
jgi:hypothetical protein